MVECHIIDFYEMSGETAGLGKFSEQAFEAMHHDMNMLWEQVKIGNIEHEDFLDRLFNFVCSYNAKHM